MPFEAREDADMRPAARAGGGDDIRDTVAIDVSGGDADAATKTLVISINAKPGFHVRAVSDHEWSRTGPGARGEGNGRSRSAITEIDRGSVAAGNYQSHWIRGGWRLPS